MPPLRILCFGASITSGHPSSHPYAIALKAHLHPFLPIITIDGLPGDRVIGGEYFSRLASHLQSTTSPTSPTSPTNSSNSPPYDYIIIQAGGNDLLSNAQPSAIFAALKKLWDVALEHDINVLALTVTETADQRLWMRDRYEALNTLIRGYEGEGKVKVADVCKKLPYPGSEEGVWEDDGLHFRPRGYDLLGVAIAERLVEVIGKRVGGVKL